MRSAKRSAITAMAILAIWLTPPQTLGAPSAPPEAAASAAPNASQALQISEQPQSSADETPNKTAGSDWAAALATLLAAVLGFLAALLVESRSWMRRKAEQVRDAQLRKLLLAARNIQQAGSRIEECKRLFMSAQVNVVAPNAAILRAKAAAEAVLTASALEERLAELRLDFLELRVLHVGEIALGEISSLIEQLEGAAALLKLAGASDPSAISGLLIFELSMSRLIEQSIEGLRQ